jgi:3-oxoacyl-[acyl-carrier-protein] synthase I
MRDVFVVADNIVSPLGKTTAENFNRLTEGVSGIKQHHDVNMAAQPFYASLFNKTVQKDTAPYTRFEELVIHSIEDALQNSGMDARDPKTLFILSTTKGNISLIETQAADAALKARVALHHSAQLIAGHFHFVNQPLVVSHACISGLQAIIIGLRLLQAGQYENVVVAGADVISRFVLSGFQSFQAISPEPCKPFDATRKGITLGEGAASIILSSNKKYAGASPVKVLSGAVSNDANHISGPSRTGEELCLAITKAMQQAKVTAADIDFISAHGTATLYNDEMEAKAVNLAGMQTIPVNSLKGYYGHTLGAAGVIESVIAVQSLKENLVLPTLGYAQPGVTQPLNICHTLQRGSFRNCLKTASGFGGCNAAIVLNKQVA